MGRAAWIAPGEVSRIKPLTRIGKQTRGFAVTCFAVAEQGNVVALGSDDGNIRLWSLAESKVLRSLAATNNGYIGSIAFSPDGKWLAYHADDHPVRLWDVESGTEVARSREEFSFIEQIRFSPKDNLVGLVDDESNAFVWNLDSNKMKKLDQPASALAFSPDGKTLALGLNTLQLVEVASGRSIQEFGKLDGRLTSLAFSPTGSQLLAVDSGCPGTTVRLVEIDSGDDTIFGEKIRFERVGAAFSADGTIVAINDGFSEAVFWNAATGQKRITLPGFHPDANSLVFTSDNQRLLSGRSDSFASEVLVWNVDEILHAADKMP
jgi:WD40 repeat protein